MTTASGTLTSVDLAVGVVAGTGAGQLRFYTDDGGAAGSLLGSYDFVTTKVFSTEAFATYTFSGPTFASNTKYWIEMVAKDNTFMVWHGNNDDYDNAAFRINAVPEPTSMVALGLGAAALIRRRRANP